MRAVRILILVICVGAFATAYAEDGKTLYRNNCKVCHDKGSKHGQYAPLTLTQAQWRKFFSTKLVPAHKSVVHPQSGKKVLEALTPDQMKSIQRFCIDHAADSEQPATCG